MENSEPAEPTKKFTIDDINALDDEALDVLNQRLNERAQRQKTKSEELNKDASISESFNKAASFFAKRLRLPKSSIKGAFKDNKEDLVKYQSKIDSCIVGEFLMLSVCLYSLSTFAAFEKMPLMLTGGTALAGTLTFTTAIVDGLQKRKVNNAVKTAIYEYDGSTPLLGLKN